MRRLTSFTAAAAVVLTSIGIAATPAEARSRHGGWGHHRDRDRISTGEVLGGLFVIGAIAAIASAASKDKTERRDRDDRYQPPYERDEYRQVPRYQSEPGDAPPPADTYGDDDRAFPTGAYGGGEAEARAADACSWAVEAEMGDDARVDRVDSPRPSDGGWYVTGIASRLGGATQSFGCSFRGGRVVDVTFAG